MSKRRSTYADYLVGQRIRLARNIMDQSLFDLAAGLCVSVQQIQKYEKGHDRISVGRLHAIAKITNMPISFFFQSIDDEEQVFEQEEFHIELLQKPGIKKIIRHMSQVRCKNKILALANIAEIFQKVDM